MLDLVKLRNGKGPMMAIVAIGVVIASLVGVAYVRANSEASAKRDPSPSANLGQAPASDGYNQAYQAKVEEMVTARMKLLSEQQAEQQKAAAEQQKAALDHMESMIQIASAKLNTAKAPGTSMDGPAIPAEPAQEPYKPAKIYSMHEMGGGPSSNAETFLGSPGDIKSAGVTDSATQTSPGPAKTNPDAYLIPEAGWVKGRMINGVIGSQDGEFRYTEIKLQGNYFGPNNYVQNLDGCVVTGEAKASLWERRFQVKPISLSCTLPNGRNKTWKTSGYVVDAKDGIQGVNAMLINNESNKLAASIGAGVLESTGSYYSQSAVNSTIAPATGSISGVVTSPGKFLAGGAVQGAGKGLQDNLKDYYDLYRSSLQVGGGGVVTVHITSTLELPDGGDALSTVRAAK